MGGRKPDSGFWIFEPAGKEFSTEDTEGTEKNGRNRFLRPSVTVAPPRWLL
jgi:hypothetical protein